MLWVFVFSVSSAVTVVGSRLGWLPASATQLVAGISAVLSLLWSVSAAVVVLLGKRRDRTASLCQNGLTCDSKAALPTPDRLESRSHKGFVVGTRPAAQSGFVAVAHVAALLFGVVPAVVLSVSLVMRMVYVGIDLVYATPSYGEGVYGFGAGGLWILGVLFVSCAVGMASTMDRRLFTCALWIAVTIAVWASLLLPAFRPMATGRLGRSGSTVALLVSLAVLVAIAAVLTGWIERRRRWRVALSKPDDLVLPPRGWPGLRQSCGVIAVTVILLVCYHLVVPVAIGPGGFGVTSLVVAGSAAVGAWAIFLIVSRTWSGNLADAAMGLTSLALCAFAVSLVPSRPVVLAERYPMIFSAMIIGFALATALWTWLSLVWEQQLNSGRPWTTAGRLIPRAKRFAFLNAAMALVVGMLLAVWPRLRGISTTDDEYGQVTAGLAANLFLLLVILWSSRRLKRLPIYILTVVSVLSTAGFILVRMLPFSPRFG